MSILTGKEALPADEPITVFAAQLFGSISTGSWGHRRRLLAFEARLFVEELRVALIGHVEGREGVKRVDGWNLAFAGTTLYVVACISDFVD